MRLLLTNSVHYIRTYTYIYCYTYILTYIESKPSIRSLINCIKAAFNCPTNKLSFGRFFAAQLQTFVYVFMFCNVQDKLYIVCRLYKTKVLKKKLIFLKICTKNLQTWHLFSSLFFKRSPYNIFILFIDIQILNILYV